MMSKRNSITQLQLKEIVCYDPGTGCFIWNKRRGNYREGSPAGYVSVNGYVMITVNKVQYSGHRLAWFYMTGEWPGAIDHVNRIRSDNRFCNLRDGTLQQNNFNKGLTVRNTSGVLGVSWCKQSNRWKANIKLNGRQIHLGFYDDIELAGLVAIEARRKYHGEFAPIIRNIEEATIPAAKVGSVADTEVQAGSEDASDEEKST